MQAIPSTTPLSRTAFCTSSVMSLTVSPPAVRRRVSCWNTFIVAAILRESLPDGVVEHPDPQWILRKSFALVVSSPVQGDSHVTGYSILEADSRGAIDALLADHPHRHMLAHRSTCCSS